MCANCAYLYRAKKMSVILHNFRLECGNFSARNTNSCKIWKTPFATFCSPITFASKSCNFSKFIDVVPSRGGSRLVPLVSGN